MVAAVSPVAAIQNPVSPTKEQSSGQVYDLAAFVCVKYPSAYFRPTLSPVVTPLNLLLTVKYEKEKPSPDA